MLVLKKGTKLTCPKCGRVMAEARKRIVFGQRLDHRDFKNIDGKIQGRAPMVCPYDGEPYGKLMLHTSEGWT